MLISPSHPGDHPLGTLGAAVRRGLHVEGDAVGDLDGEGLHQQLPFVAHDAAGQRTIAAVLGGGLGGGAVEVASLGMLVVVRGMVPWWLTSDDE